MLIFYTQCVVVSNKRLHCFTPCVELL